MKDIASIRGDVKDMSAYSGEGKAAAFAARNAGFAARLGEVDFDQSPGKASK